MYPTDLPRNSAHDVSSPASPTDSASSAPEPAPGATTERPPRPRWIVASRRLLGESAEWSRLELRNVRRRGNPRVGTEILIADPSIVSIGGHELRFASLVAAALENFGHNTVILGNQSFQGGGSTAHDRAVVPTFRESSYRTAGRRPPTLINLLADALGFASDLRRALLRRPLGPRLVFFQTSNLAQLVGSTFLHPSIWLRRSGQSQIHLFRHDPSDGVCYGNVGYGSKWHGAAIRALRPLQKSARLHFVSDSESVAASLTRLGAWAAEVAPTPVDLGGPSKRIRSGVAIGYVGALREEKGARLLPQVVERVLRETAIDSFVLQVTTPDQEFQPLHDLRDLSRSCARIELIERQLSDEEYLDLIGRLDVLVLPYSATFYKAGSSGILMEGMASGKVIVGPDRGYLALQGRGYGGYVGVDTSSANAVVEGLLTAVRNFGSLKESAENSAQHFEAIHSPVALAEFILRLGGLEAESGRHAQQ